jgi:hypothetical protein
MEILNPNGQEVPQMTKQPQVTASKVNKDDAQEWLESLQQVGEGWYRQVALAVRAGAHKALGMERREFAALIGQKLIDPREAIIELHRDKHSNVAIADVLGVGVDRVTVVLAEEGLIEMTPARQKQIEEGRLRGGHHWQDGKTQPPRSDSAKETQPPRSDSDVADLRAEIELLSAELKGSDKARKQEIRELKDKYQRERLDQERKHEAAIKAIEQKGLSEEEKAAELERARKEADAWAQEKGQQIMTSLSFLVVSHVVGALDEAKDGLHELLDKGAINTGALDQIEAAYTAFTSELNVARMGVRL